MADRIPTDLRPAFQPRPENQGVAVVYLLWQLAGKVAKRESGCWEWVGWHNQLGYGNFKIGDKVHRVHRLIYEYCVGNIPDGLLVLHRCDNPPCCNPDHLCLGDEKANIIDCVSKGRHPDQKLTEADVAEMRRIVANDPSKRNRHFYRDLARKHGVSIDTIRHAIYGITWGHVDG